MQSFKLNELQSAPYPNGNKISRPLKPALIDDFLSFASLKNL
jgi:hypothetical protein